MSLLPELGTEEYLGSFHFRVKIEGISTDINQAFTRISGVVSQSEPMEFMHGTDPYVRKGVGRTSFEDVTLERIWNGTDKFYEWRQEVEGGVISRKTVTIEMLKPNGEVSRTQNCIGAWPSRWELPEMDASGSSGAVERITLTVERVKNT